MCISAPLSTFSNSRQNRKEKNIFSDKNMQLLKILNIPKIRKFFLKYLT